MDILGFPTVLRFCATLVVLAAVGAPAQAADDAVPCELKIRGHSIVNLMLIEKTRSSGVQFDNPGESVQIRAGTYRIERAVLKDDYEWEFQPGQRQDWFEVTPSGPNELVVGAPLYPTVNATRHGGFVQLDYDTVDGAGRSYRKTGARSGTPPTFTVYKDGEEIGSGSFEYG